MGNGVGEIRACGAWDSTKHAFEFLVLTAARSGDVRGAVWSEFDFEANTYARSDLLDRRRPVMDDWTAYVA